jgi:hypothetical protein
VEDEAASPEPGGTADDGDVCEVEDGWVSVPHLGGLGPR